MAGPAVHFHMVVGSIFEDAMLNAGYVIADKAGRQYYMLGGKGGVGKTSSAASLGVRLAGEGGPTLVVSTDPAHSLSDSLDQVTFCIKYNRTSIAHSVSAFTHQMKHLQSDYIVDVCQQTYTRLTQRLLFLGGRSAVTCHMKRTEQKICSTCLHRSCTAKGVRYSFQSVLSVYAPIAAYHPLAILE